MVAGPCEETNMLPAASKAIPDGLVMPEISTAAVGVPVAAICAAVRRTTLLAATTDTQRFPASSNASTLAPGAPPSNDGLVMVMSGVLAPEVANADAG